MIFEFWIELAHVLVCYIGVYCGISIGIWLMVQAIDEVKRLRRKPRVGITDISINQDYKELFEDLQKQYGVLEQKHVKLLDLNKHLVNKLQEYCEVDTVTTLHGEVEEVYFKDD